MADISKLSKNEKEAIKKVIDYKRIDESNIVSILWKNPELYSTYDNLKLDLFTHNEWKVYFQIGYDIILREHKEVLDDITVGLYLEKHDKLNKKYDEYGGYDTITKAQEYVNEKNIDGYIKELIKWNTVLKMTKANFPIADRLSSYTDMSLEDIYDEKEALLNHIFVDADGDDETFRLSDGIYDLIDKLDEGFAVGLEYENAPILTEETGGSCLGNITLILGGTGTGKSTFWRNTVLPALIKNKEKVVIMVNEESLARWQREIIIYVCNNIFKEDVQKYKLRNGGFDKDFKAFLKDKIAKWIIENDSGILFKPFKTFNCDKAIKYIKKYSSMGIKYYLLDTFKSDSNAKEGTERINMKNNMTAIYDTIKESNKNVHIHCTAQLNKASTKQRFYTIDNVGESKAIADVASTVIMIRNLFEDELPDGKRELKVFKFAGKNKKTKLPIQLDENKHYQIVFIVKNREGSSNEYQTVIEHDMSRNTYKEIGFTCVPVDF